MGRFGENSGTAREFSEAAPRFSLAALGPVIQCYHVAADILQRIAELARQQAEIEVAALLDETIPVADVDHDLTLAPLVRLDVVVIACYLLSAHFALRATVAAWAAPVTKTEAAIGVAERLYLSEVLKRGIGQIFRVPLAMADTFKADQLSIVMREALSERAAAVQSQLRRFYLGSGKPLHPRKTRRVWSRHLSPKQRKPNKSWANPSAT
jgi:hypothetical protein